MTSTRRLIAVDVNAAPCPSRTPSAFSSLLTQSLVSLSSFSPSSSPPFDLTAAPAQIAAISVAADVGAAHMACSAVLCSWRRESGEPERSGREGLVMRGKRSS
jgi:hypothetical protein